MLTPQSGISTQYDTHPLSMLNYDAVRWLSASKEIRPTLKMGVKGGRSYVEYCVRFSLMKLTSDICTFDNNFGDQCRLSLLLFSILLVQNSCDMSANHRGKTAKRAFWSKEKCPLNRVSANHTGDQLESFLWDLDLSSAGGNKVFANSSVPWLESWL